MKRLRKRNLRNGRYMQDRTFYKYFIIGSGIYLAITFSFVGVNTILKSAWDVIIVNDSEAETVTITWEDGVKSLLRSSGVDYQYAEKIIYCESRWDKTAVHQNKGSVDRGLWQINSYFHPEVSKDCAFDSVCSTIEAIRIIKQKGFGEWVCSRYVE